MLSPHQITTGTVSSAASVHATGEGSVQRQATSMEKNAAVMA
jgi:hypothetical protein